MGSLSLASPRLFARQFRLGICFTRYYSIHATHASGRRVDPLRILFCGSDDFSIASLNAVINYWKREKAAIESIHVLCRTDKRVGQGLKTISEVPIKKAAKELDLPIHQIDNFSKNGNIAKLEGSFNLILAVSFGLLIPARVIESAKYGGLNVHPSLLPDLRGAAPIHHTLLQRRKHTGVSVQTLHPTKFDHGQILARTPSPWLPVALDSTPQDLLPELATEGARLLERVIEEQLYIPPLNPVALSTHDIDQLTQGKGLAKAPKILKADLRIDWDVMTTPEIIQRLRVFGRLWDDTTYERLVPGKPLRIVYDQLADVSEELASQVTGGEQRAGMPFAIGGPGLDGDGRVVIATGTGGLVEVRQCTIAGKSGKNGAGLRELRKLLQKDEAL